MNHFYYRSQKKITVETETLDNLTESFNINQIDILKIDVQGAEHLVISAGTQTLKKAGLVFLEFSYKPMYNGSCTFFDIYQLMTDNNFRMVSTSPVCHINGELVQSDALFINNMIYT